MRTWQKVNIYTERTTIGDTVFEISEIGYRDTLHTRLMQDGQLVNKFKTPDDAKDYFYRTFGDC